MEAAHMQSPGIFWQHRGSRGALPCWGCLRLAGDGAGAKPGPAGVPAAGHGEKWHKIAFSWLWRETRRCPALLVPLILKIQPQTKERWWESPRQAPSPARASPHKVSAALVDFEKSTWILPGSSVPWSCSSFAPAWSKGCPAAHGEGCR